MRENTFLSYDQALQSACEQAGRVAQSCGRSVLLVQDFAAMAQAKRCLATLGCGFGVKVETSALWVEDLWELWGTGESLVTLLQRTTIAYRALCERQSELGGHVQLHGESAQVDAAGGACASVAGANAPASAQVFPVSDGMVSMLVQLLRQDAPFFIEGAGGNNAKPNLPFSPAEQELIALVRRCLELEQKMQVIEPALACAYLAQKQAISSLSVVLWNVVPSASEELLFESAAEVAAYNVLAVEQAGAQSNSRKDELLQLGAALYHPDYEHPITPSGCVRFALPMGAYASPVLLTDEVQRLVCAGNTHIAISSVNFAELFNQLASRLHARGIACRATCRIPLSKTAFGVAWASLLRFVEDARFATAAMIRDYALSAFSFMNSEAAACADASLRGWRGLTCESAFEVLGGYKGTQREAARQGEEQQGEVRRDDALGAASAASTASAENLVANEHLSDVSEKSPDNRHVFVRAMNERRYEDALLCQRAWVVRQRGWSEAFREVQLAAIDCALAIQRCTNALDLPQELALATFEMGATSLRLRVLPEGAVAASCEGDFSLEGESLPSEALSEAASSLQRSSLSVAPEVTFMSLYELGKQPPASFDACVITGLGAEEYPLDDDEKAQDSLLRKLSCYQPSRKVQQLRTAFSCALAAAKNAVIIHRVLKDSNTDDARPSALFDELVDCYRAQPQNEQELHKLWGVSHNLEPFVASYGEEAMTRNCSMQGSDARASFEKAEDPASVGGEEAACEESMAGAPRENVSDGVRDKASVFGLSSGKASVIVPTAREARLHRLPHFSASAIEAYLACPFGWFVQRRLAANSIDAEMDARAKGTFAHALLQDFHQTLADSGTPRVTPENASSVKLLFTELFYQHLEEEKKSGRPDAYFPLDNRETLEVERFRKTLEDFIAWEADFLPKFHPAVGEFSFGYDEEMLYAGHALVGSVDRVDVDDAGNAVILDYKGSAGSTYYFREKDKKENGAPHGEASASGAGCATNVGECGVADGGAARDSTGNAMDAGANDVPPLVLASLPKKIQALIYAQVVRRKTGLIPVGALYVSYGAKHGCAGLYDARKLDPEHDLLGASAPCCETTAFLETLDRVEEIIAARLAQLEAGDIAPRPSEDACRYCTISAVCQRMRCNEEAACAGVARNEAARVAMQDENAYGTAGAWC